MKEILVLVFVVTVFFPLAGEDNRVTINLNGGINFWTFYLEHMNDPVVDGDGGFTGTMDNPFRFSYGGDIMFTLFRAPSGRPQIQAGFELSSYSLLGYKIGHQLLSILLKEDQVALNAALRPVLFKLQGNTDSPFYFTVGFGLSALQLDVQLGKDILKESVLYGLELITFKNELGARFWLTDSFGIHTKVDTVIGITSLKSSLYNNFTLLERMLFSLSAGVFIGF